MAKRLEQLGAGLRGTGALLVALLLWAGRDASGQERAGRWEAPQAPRTDWSVFPQGYGILLNEKLIYPEDLSLWRMKIDARRQLFVDNDLIARSANLEREFHAVRKHPANPVMTDVTLPYVFPDPAGGYRLYANGHRGKFAGRPVPVADGAKEAWPVCMATSADGLRWRSYERSVVSRTDSSAPWQPMDGEIRGVFHEPQERDPEQRWKMLVRTHGRRELPLKEPFGSAREWHSAGLGRIALYVSADGLGWTFKSDTSLLDGSHQFRSKGSPGDSPPQGVGDTTKVRWDPVLKRYVAHVKYSVGPDWRFPFARITESGRLDAFYEARAAGWSESDDLLHWSSPRVYAYPDNEDAKQPGMYGVYQADGFPYESMWLGCLSMSANVPGECPAPPRHPVGYKRNWIRLAGSRDGRTWYYLGKRDAFIPNGADDQWDAHYIRTGDVAAGGPLVKDDEIWFYYFGSYGGIPGCPGLTLPKSAWRSSLGIGILRRDGFASLNAGANPGHVITRPLVFEGTGELFVNVAVGQGGYVTASVLDEDGATLAGFDEAACSGVRDDRVRGRIGWGKAGLAVLKGRYVRLAFHVRNAKLYSFWIQ